MADKPCIDFRSSDVSSLARRVRVGEIRASDLVRHSLERIAALDGTLNAFVAVDGDSALDQADRIDAFVAAERDPGPLAGIPLAVKDLEDAAGFITTNGSLALSSQQPAASDSLLVARLRAAGAIVIGKTNTPEIGWKGVTDNRRFGPTRNPWSPDRTPGGSSGGSAAAVASGMVPLATGSDGGGSIRIPAAWCGLTGFKPSLGRIPGVPASSGGWRELSSKGVLGNKMSDILEALIPAFGPDEHDFTSIPAMRDWSLARVPELPRRIGWMPALIGASADRTILQVCQSAVEAIAQSGADIQEVRTVFSTDTAPAWHTLVASYNFNTVAHLRGTNKWHLLDPDLAVTVEPATAFTALDLLRAEDSCIQFGNDLADAFDDFDLLLTPTCATSPPLIGVPVLAGKLLDLTPYPFTHPFNMTRSPAATVHAGVDQAGMPVGLQIVGKRADDVTVIRAAAAMETILGAHLSRRELKSWPLRSGSR